MRKKQGVGLDFLKMDIKKIYGKKCPDYEDNCCVCRVWFLYENLAGYMRMAEK